MQTPESARPDIHPGPLSGVRVVDVSIMAAGPWVGALLGQLGADVIKIEPPAGDGTRWVEPSQHGMGTNFMCMNVNKRDIILDFKKPEDRECAYSLIEKADIFVQNYRVGVIDRLGLGWDTLHKLNPQLVYCSISGFGEQGPLAKEACADFIMQAYSGFAALNGHHGERVEAFRFTGFIDLTTSIVAVQALLAAILDRKRRGVGQKVEVSMLQAALEMQFTRVAEMLNTSTRHQPSASHSSNLMPDAAYRALDGEVFITVQTPEQWHGFCAALGHPEWAEDTRFSSNRLRLSHRAELDALIAPVIAERPMIWWLRVMGRHSVPCSLAQHFEQIRHHVQIVGNAMIERVQTPGWGEVTVGGLPWHFSRTPGAVRPPPVPGADNETIASRWQARPATPTPSSSANDHRPVLQGLRVIELASGVAGPLASCRLGDLGAHVTKIESIPGDWMRLCPPDIATGASSAFFALNRGKQGLSLDCAQDTDRTTLKALLAEADVCITDWSDSELRQWGLDGVDAPICPWNTRLIVARLSPWGRSGPLKDAPGSELTAQAMAGYTRYLGRHGEPAVRLGADVASCATGIFTLQAILAALFERQNSGTGQAVELSLLNSLLSMKTVHLAAQSDPDKFEGPRVGGAYDPPERGWATRDKPITFAFGGAVGEQGRAGWVDFVKELGLTHMLDDPRYDKNGRMTTGLGPLARTLKPEYEKAFVLHDSEEVVAAVRRHGGFASAYMQLESLRTEPQALALGVFVDAAQAGQHCAVLNYPAHFSELTTTIRVDPIDHRTSTTTSSA